MDTDEPGETTDDQATRWVLQWSEPYGENQAKRVVDTEADAEAVIDAWKERYEHVEDEGTYRVEMGAKVFFTKVEVPYGPVATDE